MKHLAGGLTQKWVYHSSFNYIQWNINKSIFISIILFFTIEWFGRKRYNPLLIFDRYNRIIRWVFYTIIIFFILYFSGEEEQFIYFQF